MIGTNKSFILVIFILFVPVIAMSEDINLNGNEILIIQNQVYPHTGNITLRDNSKIIIRNSTFIFEQNTHEQYAITLNNSSSLLVEQSSTLTSDQRFLVVMNDMSVVTVDNSVALNESLAWIRGAFFIPNDNSTLVSTFSRIDAIGNMYSYSENSKATIKMFDSTIQQISLDFPLYSKVNVTDFKIGLIDRFEILHNVTNTPYDLIISNTTVENSLTAWVKDNAEITFNNCEFHQVSIDGKSSVYLINSSINELWIYASDNSATNDGIIIQNLKNGYIDKSDQNILANSSVYIDVSDTYVLNWCIKIAGYDKPIHIMDSQIH